MSLYKRQHSNDAPSSGTTDGAVAQTQDEQIPTGEEEQAERTPQNPAQPESLLDLPPVTTLNRHFQVGINGAPPGNSEPAQVPKPENRPGAAEQAGLPAAQADDSKQAEHLDDKASSAPEGSAQNSSSSGHTEQSIKGRQIRDVIKEQHIHFGPDSLKGEQKKTEIKSLIEATEKLPPRDAHLSNFHLSDVEFYHRALITQRLVFISCPDQDIASAAVYTLVEELEFDDEQKRLLDLKRFGEEAPLPNIYNLRGGVKPEGETVVVMRPSGQRAGEFLDPLVQESISSISTLKSDLESNGILMICLIHSDYVEERLKVRLSERTYDEELKFPHWKISFLRPLLKHHYPRQYAEMEEKILRQRGRGWWKENESELFYEIKSYIRNRKLEDVINERENSPDPPSASHLFESSNPLHDTVIYACTFFPNLTIQEFRRLVTLLLGSQTQMELVEAHKQNADGTTELVRVQQEKPLSQIWQSKTDRIMKECQLTVSPLEDSIRVVTFANNKSRDELMSCFENEYPFFLENQFELIQNLGLIFDSSQRIAENVARLSAAMAVINPDYYGREWLVELITSFEQHIDKELDASSDAEISAFISAVNAFRARTVFYQRIANLLRTMLEEHHLDETVERLLNQLIFGQLYRPVLELTKRLRLSTSFDEFHWFRQLFERGNKDIRDAAYRYVLDYMKSVGTRVYLVLGAMDSWLPQDRRAPLRNSGGYLLSLLMEYCRETLSEFDPKHYGYWPSKYPLLAFEEAEAARSNLRLLVRLLLHPGTSIVVSQAKVKETPEELIGYLIISWSFILLGQAEEIDGVHFSMPDASDDSASTAESPAGLSLDALTVRNILLEEIVAATGETIQKALLVYWKTTLRDVREEIRSLAYSDVRRERLFWRRDVIADLIEQFEEQQTAAEEQRQ